MEIRISHCASERAGEFEHAKAEPCDVARNGYGLTCLFGSATGISLTNAC